VQLLEFVLRAWKARLLEFALRGQLLDFALQAWKARLLGIVLSALRRKARLLEFVLRAQGTARLPEVLQHDWRKA